MDSRIVLLVAAALPALTARADSMQALLSAYRPAPRGYPSGKQHARPDTSAAFRWHGYNDDAVGRFEDAKMLVRAAPYNRLEGQGVRAAYRSPVKFAFVAEHATEGSRALRVDFPARTVKAGKAVVFVEAAEGPLLDTWSRMRAVAYWGHYRWFKCDFFNPTGGDLRLRVCGVPVVCRPGGGTIAVRTADAASAEAGAHSAVKRAVAFRLVAPAGDVSLFLDNLRVEQEVGALLARKGRMLHFAARSGSRTPQKPASVLWPGFTPVEADTTYSPDHKFGWTAPAQTRANRGLSFRSYENGIVWGRCEGIDSPFRIDVPKGRWGVWIFATPGRGFTWPKGAAVRINGTEHVLFAPRTDAQIRRTALGGELWDYRPGCCLWEDLVKPPYFPPTKVLYADTPDGRLLIELPRTVMLRTIVAFPAADKAEALKELGRLSFLLAESWDVSHAWVNGPRAEQIRYIGFHAEATHPETIPARLGALKLRPADFRRGFALFSRGLTEAVYPDTIPTPAEAGVKALRCFAAPGQRQCVTFSLLPLAARKGLKAAVSDLVSASGAKIPAARIDLRFSRYHHKCMEYGHHNHAYNYQEHFLVKRDRVDLWPAAARRAYVDIAVPAGAAPGDYAGQVTIASAAGEALAAVPLTLEVLPIELKDPPVYFGTESSHLIVRANGLNLCGGPYASAVANGFAAWAIWPYNATRPPIAGKRLGWGGLLASREFLNPLIEAGRAGKGLRLLFGGPVPGERHAGKDVERIRKAFTDKLLAAFPKMDIVGTTMPTYYFHGPGNAHSGPVWSRQIRTEGKPELLEQARKSGREFWFVDWLRHSKEQPARFTFGLWLWRLGAVGKVTTFTAGYDYHYGTAKVTYPWAPYYTLLGVVGGNECPAVKDSTVEGQVNPCRDLVLIRAGIDDYRYVHTLEALVERAEAARAGGAALAAAGKFLDGLKAELSLDLAKYYEARRGSYAENWHPRPGNPWTTEKFDRLRRRAAEHVLALTRAGAAGKEP